MAMEPRNGSNSRPVEEDGSAASLVDCSAHSTKEAAALFNEKIPQSAAITGLDRSKLIMGKELPRARELDKDPPLKRFRYTVLMVPPALHAKLNDGEDMRACSFPKTATLNRTIFNKSDENHVPETSKLASEANDRDEDESGCMTPTAKENRIPEPRDLVCPPPPRKRKATALNQESPLPSAYYPSNLLINPPDLHTFPECIRALFDK